ncbi:MAG: hypothetical protein OEZ02_15455 [Anaerolineae bacterium]|nr:hypothetical protein [Anaerolineae bacterium]
MAYLLGNLLQDIYSELGQLAVSTATGGSTTTVVDSKLGGVNLDDDYNDGTVFIVSSADGLAPQGEFARISDYAGSSGTFTVEALSAAVENGDSYAYAPEFYPLRTVIELANAGLRSLGDIALVDSTTLETAAGTTEYAASVAWKRRRPLMIDYQGRSGASGDNQWVRVYDWELVPAAPGTSGLLVFGEEMPAGRDIRIWYVDSHPRVSAFDDVISETIVPDLAVSAGVERALRWQNSRQGGGDAFLLQRWNDAKVELARAQVRFPIWTPRRVSKLMKLGSNSGGGF